MLRFIVNRWWTFAIALTLCFGGFVALPAAGRADGGGSLVGDGTSCPGSTDPSSSAGDPDSPTNTGKPYTKWGAGYYSRSGVMGASRNVGDVPTQLVWVYRYRIVLRLFRAFVLRF